MPLFSMLYEAKVKDTDRRRMRRHKVEGQVERHLPAQIEPQAIDGFFVTDIIVELQERDGAHTCTHRRCGAREGGQLGRPLPGQYMLARSSSWNNLSFTAPMRA